MGTKNNKIFSWQSVLWSGGGIKWIKLFYLVNWDGLWDKQTKLETCFNYISNWVRLHTLTNIFWFIFEKSKLLDRFGFKLGWSSGTNVTDIISLHNFNKLKVAQFTFQICIVYRANSMVWIAMKLYLPNLSYQQCLT